MKHITLTIIGTLLLGIISVEASSALAQHLVDHGTSIYRIVVSPKAPETEHYAARELQRYLVKISGCTLPIEMAVVEKAALEEIVPGGRTVPSKKIVHVGFGGAPDAVLRELKPADFGKEEYIIRQSGGAILIAGGQPRGTLYGVIGFLQDHLGCRWYTKDVVKVPKTSSILIEGLNDRQSPAFEYREPWYREAYDTEFAVHNRLNPSGVPVPTSQGGSFIIYPFVHTFNRLVPVEKYFKEHPEYFSLVDGKRQNKHFGAQLCLTNPEVVRIATESVFHWIEEHPEANLFSVDQNDGYGYCECDNCAALDKAEGSHSGTILHFVNQIADAVAEKHPGVQLQTLAYVYSEVPPKTIKPRPNVTIRMCHYDYCEAHAIGQCDDHLPFVERLEAWSRITDSITIWDYYTDFRHYLIPYPNFESVINHPRFYAKRSCTGLFAQGNNVRQQGGGEFSALRAWVLAQLMWNPYQDGHALIDEFVKNVYGPAAPFVREYIQRAHDAVKSNDLRFSIFTDPVELSYLTPEFVAQSDALLEQAEQAAQDDPTLLKRIELAHLPIHYTRLYFYMTGGHVYLNPEEMPALLAKFERILRDNRIQQIAENGGAQAIKDFIARVRQTHTFITDWWIVGPFDNTRRQGFDRVYPPEKGFDSSQPYHGIAQQVRWIPYDSRRSGYIDFTALMQPTDQGVAYAYRTFEVEDATDLEVGIGSNDGVKLWLNGQLLLSKQTSRVAEPNQDILTLRLKRGSNNVLLKIDQLGGGWGFYFTRRR